MARSSKFVKSSTPHGDTTPHAPWQARAVVMVGFTYARHRQILSTLAHALPASHGRAWPVIPEPPCNVLRLSYQSYYRLHATHQSLHDISATGVVCHHRSTDRWSRRWWPPVEAFLSMAHPADPRSGAYHPLRCLCPMKEGSVNLPTSPQPCSQQPLPQLSEITNHIGKLNKLPSSSPDVDADTAHLHWRSP